MKHKPLYPYFADTLYKQRSGQEGMIDVYDRKDVDDIIQELSNILFSFENVLDLKEGKRIVRKDLKKLQAMRKAQIIKSKYIFDENNKD